ncbi:MAG: hypothetical protein EOO10_22265 [Chitinophagaceae bacterium]|nr:MAG: hypothetical protein EOO10_22265 [Chitinophagaceae bacterium]
MPLNKDTLGTALYNAEKEFNDKAPADLGDIEAARLSFWKTMADEIIKHFKTQGVVNTTGTASAQTGAIS